MEDERRLYMFVCKAIADIKFYTLRGMIAFSCLTVAKTFFDSKIKDGHLW